MSTANNTSRGELERFTTSLNPFARDERLGFVDHVCGLLAESRFGPGSVYKPISEFDGTPGIRKIVGSQIPDEYLDITERMRMHSQEMQRVEMRGSDCIDTGYEIIGTPPLSGDAVLPFSFLNSPFSTPLSLARGSPRSFA